MFSSAIEKYAYSNFYRAWSSYGLLKKYSTISKIIKNNHPHIKNDKYAANSTGIFFSLHFNHGFCFGYNNFWIKKLYCNVYFDKEAVLFMKNNPDCIDLLEEYAAAIHRNIQSDMDNLLYSTINSMLQQMNYQECAITSIDGAERIFNKFEANFKPKAEKYAQDGYKIFVKKYKEIESLGGFSRIKYTMTMGELVYLGCKLATSWTSGMAVFSFRDEIIKICDTMYKMKLDIKSMDSAHAEIIASLKSINKAVLAMDGASKQSFMFSLGILLEGDDKSASALIRNCEIYTSNYILIGKRNVELKKAHKQLLSIYTKDASVLSAEVNEINKAISNDVFPDYSLEGEYLGVLDADKELYETITYIKEIINGNDLVLDKHAESFSLSLKVLDDMSKIPGQKPLDELSRVSRMFIGDQYDILGYGVTILDLYKKYKKYFKK